MQKVCVAGAALEVVVLAINLMTGSTVLLYIAIVIALLMAVLYPVSFKKKALPEAQAVSIQGNEYQDLNQCNQEYQQLQDRVARLDSEVKDLKAQLRGKDELLRTFALQCHRIAEATSAEQTLSDVIVKKTEDATLQLTNHVYSIGDWSKDVDNLIQRVFGSLTSEDGGLRVQAVRMEEELREIRQLIEEFKLIRDDYIGELEMIEKTMKSVDQFTDTITDLSDRTNVLAINASIEAARSGQAGRGFAVIATEVQELAKNTMKIAEEISTTIESSVHTVKDSIGTYGERLEKAVEQLAESGEKHSSVIEQLTPQIDQVSQVIEESQKLSASVTENINDVTVHLQYQDSVRQILEHMVQLFEKLAREGATCADDHVELKEDERAQQKQEVQDLLKSFFTTREEWDAFGHKLDEGEKDTETEEKLSGDITLF